MDNPVVIIISIISFLGVAALAAMVGEVRSNNETQVLLTDLENRRIELIIEAHDKGVEVSD